VPSTDGNVFQQLFGLIGQLDDTNWYTLAVGVGAILLIFGIRRFAPGIPPGLVALAAGILVSAVFQLSQYGVSLVGEIPTGLPKFGIGTPDLFSLPALLVGAFGIVFLAVGESLGSARAFATKNHYNINPDQELIAMGMANLGTGLSQGMTADASLSISATSDTAGAKSQLGGLVAAALALVTILFLAPLFQGLPNAVLGAIVITSVIGLMDVGELQRYYQARRTDFALALVALFGVVLSSVLVGLMLAVFLSLLFVLYRASRAYVAILGRVPGRVAEYGDIKRHPEYERIAGLIIFRLDAQLFFANTSVADKEIRQAVAKQSPPARAIVIDLGATNDLDIASADMLHDLVSEMRDAHVDVLMAQVRGGVRDRMRRVGLMEFVGEDRVFFSVEGAVAHYLKTLAPQPEELEVTMSAVPLTTDSEPPESALAEDKAQVAG
jgi:MFS superfamily sulfate permease-like transporter